MPAESKTLAYPGDDSLNLRETLLVNPDPDGVAGLTSGGFFRKYGHWREKVAEKPLHEEFLDASKVPTPTPKPEPKPPKVVSSMEVKVPLPKPIQREVVKTEAADDQDQ